MDDLYSNQMEDQQQQQSQMQMMPPQMMVPPQMMSMMQGGPMMPMPGMMMPGFPMMMSGFPMMRPPMPHPQMPFPMMQTPMESSNEGYKSLCLSNITSENDDDLRNNLNQIFSKFGMVQIKIATYMGRKVAYINYKASQCAQQAMEAYQRKLIQLPDHKSYLEPVKNKRSPSPEDDKFKHGNYMELTPPEADPLSTRTLFLGNLDPNASSDDLHVYFSKYGDICDVDLKKSNQAKANAYAFIRFKNLDMAYNAKLNMANKKIGKFTAKIGYGKLSPSSLLWIGNLSQKISEDTLKVELEAHGSIQQLVWPKGQSYALVMFHSTEEAVTAANAIRGMKFKESLKPLRVDFLDSAESTEESHNAVVKPLPVFDAEKSETENAGEATETEEPKKVPHVFGALTVTENVANVSEELCRLLPSVWRGKLSMKQSCYNIRMHILGGDICLVDEFLQTLSTIRIDSRVSLDKEELITLMKTRFKNEKEHVCLLVTQNMFPQHDHHPTPRSKHHESPRYRNFTDMIDYFVPKNASGTFIIDNGITGCVGGHFLPSCCSYVTERISSLAPNLPPEALHANNFMLLYLHRVIHPTAKKEL